MIINSENIINQAEKIARKSLSDCIINLGIIAGRHHFTDLWARDSFFAAYGANLCGQIKATENTIQTFLSYQRSDGLIPFRIQRSPTTVSKYFGRPRYFPKPRPNFRSRQSGGLILDGGLMLIVAFAEYIKYSKNINFLIKYFPKLQQTINWFLKNFPEGLINEWFLSDWQDSVLKVGRTLYTNVLYWKALTDFSYLAGFSDKVNRQKYSELALKIKSEIIQHFWNGRFFADWIDYKRHDIFNSLSNLLTVWWGLSDKKQSESIVKYAQKNCLPRFYRGQNAFTLEENHPRYPFWRTAPWNYLIGMGDYHNRGCLWLQPGILYALSLNKIGQHHEAQDMLSKISNIIVKNKGVYEVYEKNGLPVRRTLYQSEFPFAWSAGLFLYAFYNIINK